jgi:hypothetical protein
MRPGRGGSRRDSGALHAYPTRPRASDRAVSPNDWVTKREIADYFGVTPRFIELQQHLGLPVLRMGAVNRYRPSEVEAWVRDTYPAGCVGEGF